MRMARGKPRTELSPVPAKGTRRRQRDPVVNSERETDNPVTKKAKRAVGAAKNISSTPISMSASVFTGSESLQSHGDDCSPLTASEREELNYLRNLHSKATDSAENPIPIHVPEIPHISEDFAASKMSEVLSLVAVLCVRDKVG